MKYTDISAVNWSTLKALDTSPLAYRWLLDHPRPDKPSFALGRLFHTLTLEPAAFAGRYAVTDKLPPEGWETIYNGEKNVGWATCPAKVRRGKAWDALVSEYAGRDVPLFTAPEVDRAMDWGDQHGDAEEIVTPAMLEQAEAMADAAWSHGANAALLTGGRAEETVTWTDAATGLDCKGRLDYITPLGLVDLKSTRNIEPRRFLRDAASYGYHGQLAFYHDGAVTAGVLPPDADPPRLIAVQSSAPWDVAVYSLPHAVLEAGRAWYRSLLEKLLDCTEAEWWPGVAPGVLDLDLPGWAAGMDDEDEQEEEVL